MQSANKAFLPYNNIISHHDNADVKLETDQIDLMGDFKFDGGDI